MARPIRCLPDLAAQIVYVFQLLPRLTTALWLIQDRFSGCFSKRLGAPNHARVEFLCDPVCFGVLWVLRGFREERDGLRER